MHFPVEWEFTVRANLNPLRAMFTGGTIFAGVRQHHRLVLAWIYLVRFVEKNALHLDPSAHPALMTISAKGIFTACELLNSFGLHNHNCNVVVLPT